METIFHRHTGMHRPPWRRYPCFLACCIENRSKTALGGTEPEQNWTEYALLCVSGRKTRVLGAELAENHRPNCASRAWISTASSAPTAGHHVPPAGWFLAGRRGHQRARVFPTRGRGRARLPACRADGFPCLATGPAMHRPGWRAPARVHTCFESLPRVALWRCLPGVLTPVMTLALLFNLQNSYLFIGSSKNSKLYIHFDQRDDLFAMVNFFSSFEIGFTCEN